MRQFPVVGIGSRGTRHHDQIDVAELHPLPSKCLARNSLQTVALSGVAYLLLGDCQTQSRGSGVAENRQNGEVPIGRPSRSCEYVLEVNRPEKTR